MAQLTEYYFLEKGHLLALKFESKILMNVYNLQVIRNQ